MAQGRNDNLITVLDIGSSKICAMIVRNPEGSDLQVLGTGQRESKGIRRGYIADMEQTETAIRAAVEQAERIAGINIDSAWVGFSAGGLVSKVTTIEADLGGYRIEDAHIRDLHIAGLNAASMANKSQSRQSISPAATIICPPCTRHTNRTSWTPIRTLLMSEVTLLMMRPSLVLLKKLIGIR